MRAGSSTTWRTGSSPSRCGFRKSSFVIGASLLFVAVLDELVRVAARRTPGYVAAVEERHRRGDFTEDV